MRILIIQDQLRSGGTERQSLFLAKVFRSRGHEAVILTFRPGGHLCDTDSIGEVSITTLQRFDSRVSLWAPGLRRRIRELDPSVMLCMGRTANCYAGFLQKSFPDTPVVGTIRTGKRLFPLHRWSLSRVPMVLVNSYWWKRKLMERDFPADRVRVIHNALLLVHSVEERAAAREQMRQARKIDPDTCVFLNVATFRPGKRHIDMLQAFALLQQKDPGLKWQLWLVGDGREYEKCRDWIHRNGMSSRVHMFHYQRDPFPYYAAADVAVSTSREDSLPNFLIEAQAAGLPVVAYACRGVEETCDPGKTGIIVAPGSEDLLVSALQEFASDADQRQAFSREAPTLARNRFSPDSTANRFLEVLEKLVNPKA